MPAVGDPGSRTAVFGQNTGRISLHYPEARQGHDVHLGVAKCNQNRFCHKKLLPPCSFTKNAAVGGAVEDPEEPGSKKRRGSQGEQGGSGQRSTKQRWGRGPQVIPGAR